MGISRKYPHTITVYHKTEQGYMPTVLCGVRLEPLYGAIKAISRTEATDTFKLYIPGAFGADCISAGDIVIKGNVAFCSEPKHHPDAHIAQSISEFYKGSDVLDHLEVSGM